MVLLLAHGVHGRILGHRCGEGELDVPALALDAVHGVEDFECPGIAVRGGLGGDSGDLIVVGVHDLCALRHTVRVGEGHGHIVVVHPGLTPDGKHLLLVLLAADGHRVGRGVVWGDGHAGFQHIVVGGAALVDVLGRGQDAVADVQFGAGQAGGHLQICNVPVGQEITPEGHLGGVIRLVLVVQLQLAQAPMGVAVGDDAHHLGVAGLFVGHIFDALSGAYGLGDAVLVRVDAVRRRFLLRAVVGLIEKVGIDLFLDCTIDGEVAQFILAVINIDFAQGLLLAVSGKGGRREDAQNGHENQEQGYQFFHGCLLKKWAEGDAERSTPPSVKINVSNQADKERRQSPLKLREDLTPQTSTAWTIHRYALWFRTQV